MAEWNPINYNTDGADIGGSFGKGFEMGNIIEQQKIANETKQRALDRAKAMDKDVNGVFGNPNANAKDYAMLSLKYPEMGENFKGAWSQVNDAQKEEKLGTYSKVHAAALNGDTDTAISVLQESVDAHRNAGDEAGAKNDEYWLNAFQKNPQAAKNLSGLALSSIMGADKYATTFGALNTEQRSADAAVPALRKANADATTAEATAGVADEAAAADLSKKESEATTAAEAARVAGKKEDLGLVKTQADIDDRKETNRIKAIEASLSRETNDLKRQELQMKLNDAVEAKNQKNLDRVADGENNIATADQAIQTVDELLKHPGLTSAVGTVDSKLPTFLGDTADFERQVETLQSQAFLSQIAKFKGMGALSDAEGKKLNAAIANLSLNQSPESFKKALNTIKTTMEGAREYAVKKYRLEGTPAAEGGTVVENHPKYGTVSERRLRQIAKDAGVSIEDARKFIIMD